MSKPLLEVIDQIHKLLSLTRSDNPHEAGLAASRAQSLMLKYHLSMDELGDGPKERSEVTQTFYHYANTAEKRKDLWRLSLINAVCNNNFAKFIRVGSGENTAGCIVAKEVDIEHVKYLYVYLSETIDRLASNYTEFGREWVKSYCIGAVTSVAETMAEQRLRDAAESQACTALVRRSDKEVSDKFKEFFPDAQKSRRKLSGNARANAVGRAEGKNIGIHRAMDGQRRGELS